MGSGFETRWLLHAVNNRSQSYSYNGVATFLYIEKNAICVRQFTSTESHGNVKSRTMVEWDNTRQCIKDTQLLYTLEEKMTTIFGNDTCYYYP